MKKFFGGTLCALVLVSLCAWKIQQKEIQPGKLPLVWIAGDSPEQRDQITLFNRHHPQYQLMLDPNTGGAEKVIVQSIAGVGPDLFDCFNPGQLEKYVKSGVAWGITNELAAMGIDVKNEVWQAAQSTCVYEGRVYGFPGNAGAGVIWYNKDIFDKYSVPYPKPSWTWKEFLSTARRLTVRDRNGRIKQYGVLCAHYNWTLFIRMAGGRFFSEDGTRCIVDSLDAVAGLQAMHDLVYKYHVSPTPTEAANMTSQGGWESSDVSQFGAGKAAMAFGMLYSEAALRSYKGLRAGVVDVPYLNSRITIGIAKATFINKHSLRRREALTVLKYMATPEYNEMVNREGLGISPMIQYAPDAGITTDFDDQGEDFGTAGSRIMKYAVPIETNPFVSNYAVLDALSNQVDLMRNNHKSAAAALKTAARQINEEMHNNLKSDPSLRARYNELVGRNAK